MADSADGGWAVATRTGRVRAAPRARGARAAAPDAAAPSRWTPATLCGALSAHVHRLAHGGGALDALAAHLARWLARGGGGGGGAPLAPPRVACLGLGSVADAGASANSVRQLAVLVVLGRALDALAAGAPVDRAALARDVLPAPAAARAWACAHDPAFTDADAALLAAVGVAASRGARGGGGSGGGAAACCAAAAPRQRTLLFMPHCPWALYAAELAAVAWRCGDGACGGDARGGARGGGGSEAAADADEPLLASLCIVGNSFASYAADGARDAGVPPPAARFDRARARAALARDAVGSGGGAAAEARPAAADDAISAALQLCSSGGGDNDDDGGGGGDCACGWSLDETPALPPARRGGDDDFALALSSTSAHCFFPSRGGGN